ncbi:MAG: BamA/TamA family outer membrane protein, partial [Polyangia bacterium]
IVINERYQIYDRVLRALTSDDGLVGVRPAFDFMLDYRPVVGASFFDERMFGPRTALYARAEVGGVRLIVADVQLRPVASGRAATLEIDSAYTLRDDQVFRAIPSLSAVGPDRGNSRYTLDAYDLWLRPRLRITRSLWLAFSSQLGVRRFADGRSGGGDPTIASVYCVRLLGQHCEPGTVDERQVPGFNHGTEFLRGGLSLHVDTFDRPTHPSAGLQLEVGAHYSHGLGDPSSYVQASAAVGVAVNLWQRSHILFLRARVDLVLPTNDAPVPFSELATLGGPDSLRGFRAGRFRDYSTLLFSAEYRWPIWMWADGILFVDYGGAGGRAFDGLTFAALRPDVGAGIRIRTSQHVMARVQLAYGFPDGVQLNLTLGAGP